MTKLESLDSAIVNLWLVGKEIEGLLRVWDTSQEFSSIAVRYLIVNFADFLKIQCSLIGKVNEQEKSAILGLTSLLEAMYTHKDSINELRNKWIAHAPKDNFEVSISEAIKQYGFPTDRNEIYSMANCAMFYVHCIVSILGDKSSKAFDEYRKKESNEKIPEFVHGIAVTKFRDRMRLAHKNLSSSGFPDVIPKILQNKSYRCRVSYEEFLSQDGNRHAEVRPGTRRGKTRTHIR